MASSSTSSPSSTGTVLINHTPPKLLPVKIEPLSDPDTPIKTGSAKQPYRRQNMHLVVVMPNGNIQMADAHTPRQMLTPWQACILLCFAMFQAPSLLSSRPSNTVPGIEPGLAKADSPNG
eukprot:TRINITY_DN15462_c0_g1_i1.p1 TRINITY_DN15462_c0_g1~~TRINITY_DN15462_c0_g1_i1.p1  ORF type:complete len:120 (-),score=11.77 TRINITY_DN15462_c0_g1_i1:149-508(-)